MPEHWCTVTVTDANGRRHSLDVIASSTYDAAHLYVTHAKGTTAGRAAGSEPDDGFRGCERRRQEWKGTERPVIQPAARIAGAANLRASRHWVYGNLSPPCQGSGKGL